MLDFNIPDNFSFLLLLGSVAVILSLLDFSGDGKPKIPQKSRIYIGLFGALFLFIGFAFLAHPYVSEDTDTSQINLTEEKKSTIDPSTEENPKNTPVKTQDDTQVENSSLNQLQTSISDKSYKDWWAEGDRLYNEEGDFQGALTCYENALSLNKDHPGLWNAKAYALKEMGEYEQAIIAFDETINRAPRFADAYYGKGECLEQLGRMDESQECYETAKRLRKEDGN